MLQNSNQSLCSSSDTLTNDTKTFNLISNFPSHNTASKSTNFAAVIDWIKDELLIFDADKFRELNFVYEKTDISMPHFYALRSIIEYINFLVTSILTSIEKKRDFGS